MSHVESRSVAFSHVAPSRAPPPGSVASLHSHVTHHTSAPPRSVVHTKAPSVSPFDSVSQIGERTEEERSTAPSHASHASAARSSALHHSTHSGSQHLTEANLRVHDVEARPESGRSTHVVHEVEVVEERVAERSRHSGTPSRSHHSSHRALTAESASATSSHRNITALPSAHWSSHRSRSASKAPTTVISHARSHARSNSPSSRTRASGAHSHAPSAIPSHAQSVSPSSKAGSSAPSQARSRAPTSAPHEELPLPFEPAAGVPSKAGSVAFSHARSERPRSVLSMHSRASSPTPPGTPKAPTVVAAPALSSSGVRSVAEEDLQLVRLPLETELPTRPNSLHLVKIRHREPLITETEYRVHRRHVYPVHTF